MWAVGADSYPQPPSAAAQFVRRMGFASAKPLAMFRPRGNMTVDKSPPAPGAPPFSPATVADRLDVGYLIKYRLQFDDGAVRMCSCPYIYVWM